MNPQGMNPQGLNPQGMNMQGMNEYGERKEYAENEGKWHALQITTNWKKEEQHISKENYCYLPGLIYIYILMN